MARTVNRGDDPVAVKTMTALLRKFNNSGVLGNFSGSLAECSPNSTMTLRSLARDPATRFNCPGLNDNCASAEGVTFPTSSDSFAAAKFSRTADMRNYPGGQVFWKISPPVAAAGRTFTASTKGSNFNTILTVLSGPCNVVTTNGVSTVDASGLSQVASSTGSNLLTRLTFTTNGTSNYFIEATPALGLPGRLKITITSP